MTRRQRQQDAERSAALTLAGYRVVVLTRDDVVERPEYAVATVRHHLELQASA